MEEKTNNVPEHQNKTNTAKTSTVQNPENKARQNPKQGNGYKKNNYYPKNNQNNTQNSSNGQNDLSASNITPKSQHQPIQKNFNNKNPNQANKNPNEGVNPNSRPVQKEIKQPAIDNIQRQEGRTNTPKAKPEAVDNKQRQDVKPLAENKAIHESKPSQAQNRQKPAYKDNYPPKEPFVPRRQVNSAERKAKAEETAEDIMQDIVRIQKEIDLEIKEIKGLRL